MVSRANSLATRSVTLTSSACYTRHVFVECRLLGEILPDQQGRSDWQLTSDPAVVNIAAGSVFEARKGRWLRAIDQLA